MEKRAEQIAKALREAEQRQTEQYEKAVEYVNARKFGRALTLLGKAAEGPNTTLRQRAKVYAQICRQQTAARKVVLKTADDYYNYAVKLLNDRRLDEAGRNLERARQLAPKAGYVHYATAVLCALKGDTEGAAQSLKKAIHLDPRNRVLALNDADLSSVVHHPSVSELLRPEGAAGEST